MAGSTRPDIANAVHQCARFSHNPKYSHEVGVKHIEIYLKGTRDKGIIMKPDFKKLCVDMFADDDFTGMHNTEDKQDYVSVKSRSGILLTFRNVPILWSSKLQTKIALSTLEAGYIALSQGMRDLVTARRLLAELGEHMSYKLENVFHASKV